ncbi:MAG: hypothetical protein ACM3O7_02165 [Acidobacteriota bacterium]
MAVWPTPEELRRLPANHRRVVLASLSSLSRHLSELLDARAIAGSRDDLAAIEDLRRALGDSGRARNVEAVRQALLVQADDLEPERLRGYGALTGEQAGTLLQLVAALRELLTSP